MCRTYKVSRDVFKRRIKDGWNLEEALTKPLTKYSTVDHLGNSYVSIKSMCDHYNISCELFSYRRKQGWSLKDALIIPPKLTIHQDHMGNIYNTLSDMCKKYNISTSAYKNRIAKGMTTEEALTTPSNVYSCADHLGNIFSSKKEMYAYYNISKALANTRKKQGWSLEEILTVPPMERINWNNCEDHLCNKYKNLTHMCNYYGITIHNFLRHMAAGWNLEEALTSPSSNSHSLGEGKISQILTSLGIEFKENKEIKSVIKINEFNRLRFDFYIEKLGIIEFDGEQHFTGWPHSSEAKNLKLHERDDLKTKLCRKYSIPLLRIRYDQLKIAADLIKDFINNPNFYLTQNNKFLTNKQYWSIRKI